MNSQVTRVNFNFYIPKFSCGNSILMVYFHGRSRGSKKKENKNSQVYFLNYLYIIIEFR